MKSSISTECRKFYADLREVLLPWLTTRVLIAAGFITAYAVSEHLVPTNKPNVLSEGLIAWDGTWYRDIAMHGYDAVAPDGLRFFPLFPLLGRVASVVTLGRTDFALILVLAPAFLFTLLRLRPTRAFAFSARTRTSSLARALVLAPGSLLRSSSRSRGLFWRRDFATTSITCSHHSTT